MKCPKPLLAAFFLLATIPALAQYSLSPPPRLQFFDGNGQVLAGGLLYSFAAGTNTQLATYSSSLGTVNPNPIVLDSSGYADVWLANNTAYKLCLADSNNVQLWCIDNIKNAVISQASDILGLFGGACSSSTFLRGDGICVTPLGGGNVSTTGLTTGRIPYANGATTLVNGPFISKPLTNSALGTNLQYLEVSLSPWIGALDMGAGGVAGLAWEVLDGNGPANGAYLYRLDPVGRAVLASTSDTSVPVYVALGDDNGLAQLFISGNAYCLFDNSEIIGDYVTASSTVAGKCHDAGSAPPPTTFVVGIATSAAGEVALYPYLNGAGGLPDPGSNGIVKRTGQNQTAVAGVGDLTSLFNNCGSPTTEALYADGQCRVPAGSGNVSTTGLTANKLPVASGSLTITDSFLQQTPTDGTNPGYVEYHTLNASGLLNYRDKLPQGELSAGIIISGSVSNYQLVKMSGSQWIAATTADTNTLVLPVLVISNDNGSPSPVAVVQISGFAKITPDNGVTGCTSGHVVVASSTIPGAIHDAGATPPTGAFIVGTCVTGSSPSLVFLTPSFH